MRTSLNPFNTSGQTFVPVDGNPEFSTARHTKKSYAAQNREAKRRRKAKIHGHKIK